MNCLRRLGGSVLGPIFLGAVLGGLGSVLFALLCPGVYWVMDPGLDQEVAFPLTLAGIGAIAGALVGLCAALDRGRPDDVAQPPARQDNQTVGQVRTPVNQRT